MQASCSTFPLRDFTPVVGALVCGQSLHSIPSEAQRPVSLRGYRHPWQPNAAGTPCALCGAMISATQIKPNTPVVCSNNRQFAVVDHVEGTDAIKLKKDESGEHHYIPLSWVTSVDEAVHVDRPGPQAKQQWSTEPFTASRR